MDHNRSSVGQRVQSLRRQRGWSAQQLAQQCARAGMPSLTRGTLAKIESGVRKSVTAEELVVLARALDVNVAELLPVEEPPASSPTSTDPRLWDPTEVEHVAPGVPSADLDSPYFFLSYARTPKHDPSDPANPDAWVEALYTDLCRHIMQMTDVPRGTSPGFMAQDVGPGEPWPHALPSALANCRVFVPLYSNRYFESETCGKEWFAFSQRVSDTEARSARRPEAIIPAIWVPVDRNKMPEAARQIQVPHHHPDDSYMTHGFYGIMKLSRFRDEYEYSVYELARHIVRAAEEEPALPGRPSDYLTLASAFGQPGALNHLVPQVRLTVVAPTLTDLPAKRGAYHYGNSALDWNPYRPDSKRSLAAHASDLVRNLDYRPASAGIDEHGVELASDHPPIAPEVVLIDPWATSDPETAQILRRFDSLEKPWVQVVVLWNRDDKETADAEPRLRDQLNQSLGNKLAEGRATSVLPVRGVPTLEDFNAILPSVVRTAVRHYLRNATAYLPTEPTVKRPRLFVPESDAESTHG